MVELDLPTRRISVNSVNCNKEIVCNLCYIVSYVTRSVCFFLGRGIFSVCYIQVPSVVVKEGCQ